jgi:tetratricopeptide (TPR) repeat protein
VRKKALAPAVRLGPLLVAALLLAGGVARAQGKEPNRDPTREQGAAQHLAKARDLYQAGSYAAAITEMKAAYAINPLPRILCNLAKAYRKNGQLKDAAEHFDLCLRTDPQLSPQERTEFSTQLEQLRAVLAPPPLQKPDPLRPEPLSPLRPPPGQTASSQRPEVQPDPPQVGTGVGSTPVAEPTRPIYKRAWFWGVIGGVAAAGIIATAVGVAATRSKAPTVMEPELPMGVPVFAWQ